MTLRFFADHCIIYGSLTLIPLALLIASMLIEFTLFKLSILVLLLIIGFYSGTVSRKKSCASCKMKLICPGSAVKESSRARS